MSDDLTLQQRPSAAPYVLGGAAVGGGGGFALSKWANVGIPAKYSSWEEAIKDTNDEFVKKRVEKSEGEVKTAWETIQTQRKAVAEAEKAYNDVIPEALRENAETKEYLEKLKQYADKKAENKGAEELAKPLEELKASFTKFKAKAKEAGSELPVDFKNQINEKGKALVDARAEAEKVLKEDVLKQCKRPAVLLTALVGAAALALIGAKAAPKNNNA